MVRRVRQRIHCMSSPSLAAEKADLIRMGAFFVAGAGTEPAAGIGGRTGITAAMSFSMSSASEPISRCVAKSWRIFSCDRSLFRYGTSGVPNLLPPPAIIQPSTSFVGSLKNGTDTRFVSFAANSRLHRLEKCLIKAVWTEKSNSCLSSFPWNTNGSRSTHNWTDAPFLSL